jgi:ATP-dependent DNA helicase RecG
MASTEILQILSQGEDSRNQFKKDVHNGDSLAAELVAFSNTLGGRIFVGVNDDGSIAGLTAECIRRINQLLSATASDHVKPSINPISEIVTIDEKRILVIDVANGVNKPYQDKNGVIWVKNGSDKRKATSREELQRLFQQSSLVHADEVCIQGTTANDIDMFAFKVFFQKEFEETVEEQEIPLINILENMNLARHNELNLACLLLFGKNNRYKLPTFMVKCVCYPGSNIDEDNYIESQDNTGLLFEVFKDTTSFLNRNIRSLQGEQGVNSIGIKEIPKIVFEELVANALIHRDYFISAPVRIFIFSDRIEIISPGHLPNNLTIQNIKAGNSNIRNPILASFATKILPYRGLGNGVRRALKAYPDIDFNDDKEANLFKCIIHRKSPNIS